MMSTVSTAWIACWLLLHALVGSALVAAEVGSAGACAGAEACVEEASEDDPLALLQAPVRGAAVAAGAAEDGWSLSLGAFAGAEEQMLDGVLRNGRNLSAARHLSDSFKFLWSIAVKDGTATTGTVTDQKNGCGKHYQKCHCDNPQNVFTMKGRGTSGTATGLDFTCEGVVFHFNNARSPDRNKVTCTIRTQMPVWGANHLHVSCDSTWIAVQVNGSPFPDVTEGGTWKDPPADWIHCKDCNFPQVVIDLAQSERQGPLPEYTAATGFWKLAGSGGTMQVSQSVTSSRTLSRSDAESVSNSVTMSVGFESGGTGTKMSLGLEYGHTWGDVITSTFSETDGTVKTRSCSSISCPGGYFQWYVRSTSDDDKDGPAVTTQSCNFICQEGAGEAYAPMCPLGWCNRNYWGDSGSTSSKSKNYQCPCCLPGFQYPEFECRYDSSGEPLAKGPYTKGNSSLIP
ncbi:unnamed protein product [Polarella glacialis]|uniref:Uncharacterized protein n=1 Tax=Polarella glacialis TaxID=89957 RepID=A0A813IFY4_POLGL|nr:unnamed protein product [Polarella glacialis]CAE8599278.1 unnamed protein product [Polarella glacialis]CAE8648953.1 unnamed protein product [Polarella glacialis]